MISYYLQKAKKLPPDVVIKKAVGRFVSILQDKLEKTKYCTKTLTLPFFENQLRSFIDVSKLDVSEIDKKVAEYHIKMYLAHRFDLLGSGWVKNSYDSIPLGLEGYKYEMNVEFDLEKILRPSHVERARQIWKLIDKDYEPIDWQKDFKSGYRWSAKEWYIDARKVIGKKLGVDIKVPWELARMQHLPQLAVFSLVLPEYQKSCVREFKNQVLDFIATNPSRMGVNWACTMDVAIRATNMLIAYDMFCQLDKYKILTEEFKKIFAGSIYEHGEFIINNLEWSEWLTSNHYLANIGGLLFIGAYLNREDWISFASHEIIKETGKQFYEDGGNFESSTSYHRLSGEMVIYSTALILRLLREEKIKKIDYIISRRRFKLKKLYNEPVKSLPQWFIDRLYKIGRFTVDITKPNGEIPQIGDNDNGRFIKLTPVGKFLTNKETEGIYLNLKGYNELISDYDSPDGLFWDETILNHQTFVSAVRGLFDDEIFQIGFSLEKSFVETISGGEKLKAEDKSYKSVRITKDRVDLSELKYEKRKEYNFPFSLDEYPVRAYFYPDSGIYIFKNERFYLSICATPLGQNGNGGHTHNDKLSYELWIDGKNVERDPGTYLYTPLPYRRNEFRSTKSHNVPIVGNIEQNSWNKGKTGLFGLFKGSKCFVRDFGYNFIEIVLEYKDIKILRRCEIKGDNLNVVDVCNEEFSCERFGFYSSGYGKVSKNA